MGTKESDRGEERAREKVRTEGEKRREGEDERERLIHSSINIFVVILKKKSLCKL